MQPFTFGDRLPNAVKLPIRTYPALHDCALHYHFPERTMSTEKLIEGYRTFKETTFKRDQETYKSLATSGQQPKVLIIGCSDSRVSPSVVLGVKPGEVFQARNIANIVPAYRKNPGPRSIGAVVEFAVKVLKVNDIVIKGHARCGGVEALVNRASNLPETEYLEPWVEVAAPARARLPSNFDSLAPDKQRLAAELAVIRNSMNNLETYPWVKAGMNAGTLQIHGWHFDFETGVLLRYEEKLNDWVAV
jgi:carbonic anhydrase